MSSPIGGVGAPGGLYYENPFATARAASAEGLGSAVNGATGLTGTATGGTGMGAVTPPPGTTPLSGTTSPAGTTPLSQSTPPPGTTPLSGTANPLSTTAPLTGAAGLTGAGTSAGSTVSPPATTGSSASPTGVGTSASGATAATAGGVQLPSTAATAATGATAPDTSASAASSNSSIAGTDTFLQLLVAQMHNQDPMQPMDDQSFITELAQFNTVEQMLNLKQSSDATLSAQQATEGVALLGKTVTYAVPGVGGQGATSYQGIVTGVSLVSGQVQLQVGTQNVPLSEVTAVSSQ